MRLLLLALGCIVSSKGTDSNDTKGTNPETTNCEVCDGKDNNGDGRIDEDFGDADLDGIADCVDEEECDKVDNNGDGVINEGYPDTDGDGLSDCIDSETCDGLDNDGNGLIDDGFTDLDGDGIADCDAEPWCDGKDNDEDGLVDEGYPDTDNDGIADCIDPEECDGLDNNGDGQVDEGYDNDGDGIADCIQESCNCEDDDGDGLVDEGLDCLYGVNFDGSADDTMEVFFDGSSQGTSSSWRTLYSRSFQTTAGTHHIAVAASDLSGVIAGFNARVDVPGHNPSDYDTGLGVWRMSLSDPELLSTDWEIGGAASSMSLDSNFLAAASCTNRWASSPSGGAWIWGEDCEREDLYPNNWFYLEVEVCPSAAQESCDGIDNDGDGKIDEGFPDDDFDGIANCQEEELCDDVDNNGDGINNEGYGDIDNDGTADCIDAETCDGIDNDGDGIADNGFSDTDRDGMADCIDPETCDGLDNNGDGSIDEIFIDTDGDGTADCVDPEDCDGLDNNGDGQVDEGYTDTDGDGTADCVDVEICNCEDDNGDGSIDEALNCSYTVELTTSADDAFEAWIDGTSWGNGNDWRNATTLSTQLSAGRHAVAIHAWDIYGIITGVNASMNVPGADIDAWNTGLGLWQITDTAPTGTAWLTAGTSDMEADDAYLVDRSCGGTWGTGAIGPSGGSWVWMEDCLQTSTYSDNWLYLDVDVCPESLADNDQDGVNSGEDCDDNNAAVYPGAPESCDDAIDNDCDPTTDCQGFCVEEVQYEESCDTTSTFTGPVPVLHWTGDGSRNQLTDVSGNGWNGAQTGTWSMTSGVVGNAQVLDGSTAFASVDPGDQVSWTSSQWVRMDQLTGSNVFLSSNGNGFTYYTGWGVLLDTQGRPGAYVESGLSSQETAIWDTEATCTGGWTHIAASWESGTLRLYVNGVMVNSVNPGFNTILYGQNPFVFGYDINQNIRWLDGAMDEVALWDSRLSDAQIAELFEDGACHRQTTY